MPSSIRSSRSRSLSRLTAFFGRSESRNRDNDTDRQTHSPDDTLNVPQVRGRSPGNRLTKRDRSQSNHRLPAVFRSSSRSSSTTAPSAWPPKNYSQEEQVGWRPPSLHNSDASGSRPGSVRSDRGESRGPSRANSVAKALAPPSSFVPPDETKSRRKSWMFGGSRRKTSGSEQVKARAWIAGHPDGRVPYDLGPLLNAGRVPELWNSSGDTLVYLFPRTTDRGPSFKIHSSVFASSPGLTQLAYGSVYSTKRVTSREKRRNPLEANMQSLNIGAPFTPPLTPKGGETESLGSSRDSRKSRDSLDDNQVQIHLYLPITLSTDASITSLAAAEQPLAENDIETLIAVRNFFAFLVGQSLLATERRSSLFFVFLKIADILQSYSFTNSDCSTFGEVPSASFDNYIEELGLADVRSSREKTIECLVLGERMRSATLYNEAFVHAVGRYDDILALVEDSGTMRVKFSMVNSLTRSRLERASIDLFHRQKSIETRLIDFEFPSIFAGIMNSRTADERKTIRFGEWKDGFLGTRKHVLYYYKQKFGSWPPKASSKKNNLETSGLNRQVLRVLYKDFSDLYDLLVDRTSLTTRTADIITEDGVDDPELPVSRVLRRVFDEYDRSSPPVQPPVPFDVPLMPDLAAIRQSYGKGNQEKDLKARLKKLSEADVSALLDTSSNPDTLALVASSPFLTSIRLFEKREARGRNVTGLVDLRAGLWIFLYAVLQALPMIVIDAPGVRYSMDVEYFLCQPPRSGIPWALIQPNDGSQAGIARANAGGRMSWYNIAGSTGMVNLPSDLVEHGVEGVYRRSHCWLVAAKWSKSYNVAAPSDQWNEPDYVDHPLTLPPILAEGFGGGASIIPRPEPSYRIPSNTSQRAPSSMSHSRGPSSAWSASGAAPLSPTGSAFRGPSPAGPPRFGSRPASPNRGRARDTVVALGLEALPLPAGVAPMSSPGFRRSRDPSLSAPNEGKTFDDIFKSIEKSNSEKGGVDKKAKRDKKFMERSLRRTK